MTIFCKETDTIKKKNFMFKIYDKDDKGAIPIVDLRNIITNELFTRSHYDDVNKAIEDEQNTHIKSSYSDRVMKEVMKEIMAEYDTDDNKMVDLEEF